MGKEIRLLVPITTEGLRVAEDVADLGGPEVTMSVQLLAEGPASIESHYDEVLAIPDLLRIAAEAENDGADAVIIDCMGDPGLEAARELLSIPVYGPAQTTMHIAAMLGHRFCVVTVLERLHSLIHDLAVRYGVDGRMTRPRSVGIPVLEIEANPDALVEAFIRESIAAVKEEEVDAIILGCTGFYGLTEAMEKGLEDAGIFGVPVLDPIPVTVEVAAGLLRQGVGHSKRGYPLPPEKTRPGCGITD